MGGGSEKQHKVLLTKGFWLAETACTQELWEGVMGENPSEFKDAQNPVEQVSWEYVDKFFDKLKEQGSDINLRLPSEAEWEYACRAGTTTPFSFGENITTDQVNYNGEYPYADGAKGDYREKTVPVKSLPCNDWGGLYEMHGNVWEWCADKWQSDISDLTIDPLVTDGEGIVIRGGGCLHYGRHVRSAMRGKYSADNRHYYVGFRFALGHMS